ncbi:NAD(P)/FAD-dependent oxidoreductase [Gammaproteobacteria bacterium AB-CW1]|uniref:Kynurenine 3-monooxygenase n=1 Tax=Natronospira elongata TaxID=3110268 RepID=A0AAP6MKV6_9GAMM|nr:NAD(P)/FAD-dependent oxidoreductase [Gammaproteobacteria bacterium AB-CW1]
MSNEKIMIAGAGLAGSLMAVYLARRGFDVTVFEKRPDMRQETISAGRSINLALANRGIAGLEGAGVMDRVNDLLIPMEGRMLHDEQGGLDFQAYGKRPEEVIYSVSRGELNKRLMDAAEETGRVRFHFNQALESVDFEQRRIHLIDELRGEKQALGCDRLIATDGAGSPTRQAMEAHLGMTVSEELLGHGYKELNIPGTANGDWQMERGALHIWPRGGYMLIALPNLDGSFTVTLFLPHKGEPSFNSLGNAPEKIRSFFESEFSDATKLMPDLLDTYLENPLGKLGTVRSPQWRVNDFALLLGDAAHAIVPFHGQGMNCAFEDCLELDRCLDEFEGDWTQAFAATEARRKPNANAIADMALENYVEMRDSVRDPKFKLQRELGWKLEERHPNRFIPRYSMVMFHHLPYAEAQSRGRIQQTILNELTADTDSLEGVDMKHADELVRERLSET